MSISWLGDRLCLNLSFCGECTWRHSDDSPFTSGSCGLARVSAIAITRFQNYVVPICDKRFRTDTTCFLSHNLVKKMLQRIFKSPRKIQSETDSKIPVYLAISPSKSSSCLHPCTVKLRHLTSTWMDTGCPLRYPSAVDNLLLVNACNQFITVQWGRSRSRSVSSNSACYSYAFLRRRTVIFTYKFCSTLQISVSQRDRQRNNFGARNVFWWC